MINFLRYHNLSGHDARPYMPFRSDAEKKLIVASDYEFLAEALEHRKRALNLSDGKRLTRPWRIPLDFRLLHALAEIFWYRGKNYSHQRLFYVPSAEDFLPANGGIYYYYYQDSGDPSSEVIEKHPEFNYWELSDIVDWYDKNIYDVAEFPKVELERIRNYSFSRAPLSANDILALYKACSFSNYCGMPWWEGDRYQSGVTNPSYYDGVEEFDWDESFYQSDWHLIDPSTGKFFHRGRVYGEIEYMIIGDWDEDDQPQYINGHTKAQMVDMRQSRYYSPNDMCKPFCVGGSPFARYIYLLEAHRSSIISTNRRTIRASCNASKFFQYYTIFSFDTYGARKYRTLLDRMRPYKGDVEALVATASEKVPYFKKDFPLQEGEFIVNIDSRTDVYLQGIWWFWDLEFLDGYTIDASKDFGQVDVHFEG